jgi:PadR family transcriptional regulator, regulatory protein PadR
MQNTVVRWGGDIVFSDTQLMKGILEGCVLGILSKEETYGYKIVEIFVKSGFEVNEATVYPILLRLQGQGYLQIEKRPSQLGPDRKYYSLTLLGKKYLQSFESTWQMIKVNVDKVLEVKQNDTEI